MDLPQRSLATQQAAKARKKINFFLILAFEVIVQLLMYTLILLLIIQFFPFFVHYVEFKN